MKIKKPVKVKAPPAKGMKAPRLSASSQGGPMSPAAVKNGTIGKKAVTVTFVFALIAMAVAGALVYIMYRHWEFLMPA